MRYFLLICLFLMLILLQIKFSGNENITLPNIFTVYWFILIGIGIPLYINEYSFNYLSFYWILIICILYYVSFMVVIKKNSNKETKVDNKSLLPNQSHFIYISVIIFIALRVVGLLYFMHINDIYIGDILNPESFMPTLNKLTQIKYHIIESNYSPLISITNTLSFVGLLLFGYYYFDLKKYNIKIVFFVVAVFLFSCIITASKSDIIFAIIVFLSSFIIQLMNRKISLLIFYKNNKKSLMILSGFVMLIFVFISLFFVLRSNFETNPLDGWKRYGFGMIPAFDSYFSTMIPNTLSLGKYTFLGILEFFGYSDPSLTLGVYQEITIGNFSTNIFTVFRSLIDDFGVFGSTMFFAGLGGLTGFFHKRLKNNPNNSLAVVILSFICIFILDSFTISIGNYFSICLSYFLFYCYLIIFNNLKINNLFNMIINKLRRRKL